MLPFTQTVLAKFSQIYVIAFTKITDSVIKSLTCAIQLDECLA